MSLPPPSEIRYCPRCTGPLVEKSLPFEDRPRLTCSECDYVFYLNPKLVAGTVPEKDGRIYLLRRGLDPRMGTWTYPAGYLELGETVEEAARRETLEETGLVVEITGLINVYSRPDAGVVVIVYRASVISGQPRLCPETLEIKTFSPDEIPWNDLSFPTTRWALNDWGRAQSTSPQYESAG